MTDLEFRVGTLERDLEDARTEVRVLRKRLSSVADDHNRQLNEQHHTIMQLQRMMVRAGHAQATDFENEGD